MDERRDVFCPNCGMKNEAGDMFCGNCGTRLEVRMEQPKPPAAAAVTGTANQREQNTGIVNTNNTVPQNHSTAGPVKDPQAGNSHATASLVLGIIAVVCWFFGYSAIISVVLGLVGIALAGKAKEEGFEGGTRTAGFVLSLIGLIGGAVILIACVACVGSMGMLGASMY